MSKLFERHEAREDGLPGTTEALPELPDDVTVPDDARTLTHPTPTTVGRPASGIRWMRWSALGLLVAGGAIVIGLALRGDTTETDVPATVEWTTVAVGPGSNSLAPNLVPGAVAPQTPTEGPGSTTLAPTWVPGDTIPWTHPTAGPGSSTLAP